MGEFHLYEPTGELLLKGAEGAPLRDVVEQQRRREVVQQALERIYDGAGFTEADCLLDQFHDLGAEVTFK